MAHAPMMPWWLPLVVVGLGAAAYLIAVARLRGRGDRWPPARTVWAAVGLGILAAALVPAPVPVAAFPLQVARHLLMSMAAPAALALSAPLTLAMRALRPPARRYLLAVVHSSVAGVLMRAAVVLVLEIGGTYLYYLTPLYMLAEHVGWLHLLVHVHMFLAGCLLSWFLIGRDPVPTRPRTRTRLLVLFAAAGCHDVMAKLMYAHLLPRAAGSSASVELGAQIMFYGGDVVELLLATALLLDWYRRGARALAREDRRHAGPGPRCPRGDAGYPNTMSASEGHPTRGIAMGLFRTALLLGIGYTVGRPAVRHELATLVGRIRGLVQHADMIHLHDREWTQLDVALHLPPQSRGDGRSGHPSSGLQWPRPRPFPRPAATPGQH